MNRPLAARESRISVRASGWTLAALSFTVAVLVLLAAYWPTLRSLVSVWAHSGTYQYAFLIFPLSIWVAFTLRHQVRANPPKPSVWGLLAIAALVLVWYAGNLLDINLAQHFAFVTLFPALVLACWGWRALWALVFPLTYLVAFAIPWGNGLVGPLQDITAHFAVHALDLTGTPVLLNGREIITPSATWMVEDACSGVKFFAACTALGCLYAYLMYLRWWKRVLFVLLAAVVPIVANGFRVYFTVLIGETWGMHYATGTDHLVFGWQFFGTVLVLLLLAGWFFRDSPVALEQAESIDTGHLGARSGVWLLTSAMLVAGPTLAMALTSPTSFETVRLTVPSVAGWRGTQAAQDGWQPSFRGAAGEVRASYRSAGTGGKAVDFYHAVYTGRPREGHSLIAFGNDVYDPVKSRILNQDHVQIELAGGRSITAGELRLSGVAGSDSRLVWYWYCVDQRCTRWPVWTKLLQAWDVLRGRVPQSSVWAVSSVITNGNTRQTRAGMHEFVGALPVSDKSPSLGRRSTTGAGKGP